MVDSMNFPSSNAQGKKVDSKPKSKIEIKEEDIAIVEDDGDFYVEGKIISICRRDNEGFDYDKCNQLKKQIIQDHEDAKKWREWLKNNKTIGENLQQGIKDRQIVKRLEEGAKRIEFIANCLDDFHSGNSIKEELQKILERKK